MYMNKFPIKVINRFTSKTCAKGDKNKYTQVIESAVLRDSFYKMIHKQAAAKRKLL